MTDNEMRVRVAKRLGVSNEDIKAWLKLQNLERQLAALPRRDSFSALGIQQQIERIDALDIPDFPNDLNACADMRRSLSAWEQIAFGLHLLKVVHKGLTWRDEWSVWRVVDATGRQQCEAFLRVHGEWEDDSGGKP